MGQYTFWIFAHFKLVVLLFQMKPSQFIFQMSLDTEKKLANQHTVNVPRKLELLDMSEQSHQKVILFYTLTFESCISITPRHNSVHFV